MAWTDITYKCGHTGRVQLYGKSSQREWRVQCMEQELCHDCKLKIASEKEEQLGLKEINTGSEKQISWARVIRVQKLEQYQGGEWIVIKYVRPAYDGSWVKETYENIRDTKLSARWWIDRSEKKIDEIIVDEYKSKVESMAKEAEKIERQNRLDDMGVIAYPENRKTDNVVDVQIDGGEISLLTVKDDYFRSIVKNYGYKWRDGRWRQSFNKFSGPVSDRAAEIGNKLLNEGYPVSIQDDEIREKAIHADYETQCRHWITWNLKHEKLGVLCERGDGTYDKLKKVKGFKYQDGIILVAIESYNEVIDFAELNGFKISDGAMGAIERYKEKMSGIKTVNPSKHKIEDPQPTQEEKLEEVLESSREVLTDLRD